MDWLQGERERLTMLHNAVLLYMARTAKKERNTLLAVDYYERALASDPYNEALYYELIEMLLAQRAVYNARSIAKKMITNIEIELGVPCQGRLEEMFRSHMYFL